MTSIAEQERTVSIAGHENVQPSVPGNRPAAELQDAVALYRKRRLIGFSIFGVFFVFYLGTAIVQTPACESVATTPCLGMPLGLLLSLGIFPVSWALIALFFWKMR